MRESPISCAPTKYRPTPNQRKGWVGCSTANMHADPCSDAHGRAGPNPYRVAGATRRETAWRVMAAIAKNSHVERRRNLAMGAIQWHGAAKERSLGVHDSNRRALLAVRPPSPEQGR